MEIQVMKNGSIVIEQDGVGISSGPLGENKIREMIEHLQDAIDDLCVLLPYEDRLTDPASFGLPPK